MIGFISLLFAATVALSGQNSSAVAVEAVHSSQTLRIGYFHGGRTALLFRIYENNGFADNGLSVDIYSKNLYSTNYRLAPRSIPQFLIKRVKSEGKVGKATGIELIDAMVKGQFDCATVGEASFVLAAAGGKPMVAVMELGHDVRGQSGHVFLMRKGLPAEAPKDFFGKVLVARRAGPFDAIMLKEFLETRGIKGAGDAIEVALPKTQEEKKRLPQDKAILVPELFEDLMDEGMANGVIDGGYFHLMYYEQHKDAFRLVARLENWADAEWSHALLVCNRDYALRNAEFLTRFAEVVIRRTNQEQGLSFDERSAEHLPKGRKMASDAGGGNYPQHDLVPVANREALASVMRLLRKHGYVSGAEVRLEDFISDDSALKAAKNLGVENTPTYGTQPSSGAIRIAYFHGGKTYPLFRAYAAGFFDREGVSVEFHTQYLNGDEFHLIPASAEKFRAKQMEKDGNTYLGKVSGDYLAQAIARGDFAGGTIGESSFIDAVSRGLPLVAVAMLAHDTAAEPAKAIVLRRGLDITQAKGLRGMTLASRRGGPGEGMMLREYFLSVGLVAGRDVKLVEVDEDKIEAALREERIDGGLFHVYMIRRLIKKKLVRIFRKMDWMNPELSQGLLVFRKDFILSHPDDVAKFVRAYVRSIRSERLESRVRRRGETTVAPYSERRVPGMNLPQSDDPPRVRPELLREVQRLMHKHGLVSAEAALEDFVDLRWVEDAVRNL